MKRERGLTMTGFLTLSIVLIFAAFLVFRLLPPYLEYFAVQKAVDGVARDLDLQTATSRDVRGAFDKHALIDNITTITGEDLEIVRQGDDVVVNANYSVKVPIIANVAACIDFQASSAKRR
ncbi:MAG TPA: DUF4845 domain-containing protein [Burkholderiales bacterium]|nr:DUF4845 domain-containing protein [Burkholderiales bacterium]